ncbi:hypothetical protein [Saccharopolyspora sp. NPDC002578]
MRINTLRRTSAIAGLALVPALAFGAAAQAAPATPAAPTSASAEQAPAAAPQEAIAETGTISQVGQVETPEGRFTAFQFGPEGTWWLAGADTVVTKGGQVVAPEALQVGDDVTAEGEFDGRTASASRVEVR